MAGPPLMDREGVDRELDRLREEKDRISAALLDLESHGGHQLLKGAELSGATLTLWEETQGRIVALWRTYDAYSLILDMATELRGRGKISQQALAEVAKLLTGPAIELKIEDVPLAKRTLLGPTAEKLTLNQAVTRMTRDYEAAADNIARADDAWSQLLPRLSEVEEKWKDAGSLLGGTEHTGHSRIGEDLKQTRKAILSDPLGADGSHVDAIARELGTIRSELREVQRLRADYDGRVAQVTAILDQMDTAATEAAELRETLIVKIANPVLPELPRLPLRERLQSLDTYRNKGQWLELATRVADLERSANDALAQARGVVTNMREQLERREELRGRLGAYRAKAGRMGYAEDAELDELYQRARELLWAAPCDLRQATVALAAYQRAIGGRE